MKLRIADCGLRTRKRAKAFDFWQWLAHDFPKLRGPRLPLRMESGIWSTRRGGK